MATFGSSVSRLPRSLFFQLLRSLIFRLLVERCRKMLEAQFSSFLIKKLAASLFFRHQKPGCQLENKATSLVFELLRSLLFRLQALFSGCKPKKQASRRIWDSFVRSTRTILREGCISASIFRTMAAPPQVITLSKV